jgi:hypothetical protein
LAAEQESLLQEWRTWENKNCERLREYGANVPKTSFIEEIFVFKKFYLKFINQK